MKQTAVEWLIEQMLEQGYFDGNKPLTFTNLDHLQQQAKAMEKRQVVDAYRFGLSDEDAIGSKKYYNKTFKK
jgi:hypothetical protein